MVCLLGAAGLWEGAACAFCARGVCWCELSEGVSRLQLRVCAALERPRPGVSLAGSGSGESGSGSGSEGIGSGSGGVDNDNGRGGG